MKQITSPDNPEIKNILKLHSSKERRKQKKFIAEGLRTIQTLINGKIKIDKIYLTENQINDIQNLISQDKIRIVTEKIIKKISATKTPSSLLGTFFIPQEPMLTDFGPGLVLAKISDPGNMGTLIRTAAACNVKTVIIIEGVDPWSPKVIQATAGAISFINIFHWNWQTLLKNKKNLQLCALVVKGGKSINKINKKNALIIVGSEAHGIPIEWQKQSDILITLDMPGKTESLNAAIAGSIATYLTFCDLKHI